MDYSREHCEAVEYAMRHPHAYPLTREERLAAEYDGSAVVPDRQEEE